MISMPSIVVKTMSNSADKWDSIVSKMWRQAVFMLVSKERETGDHKGYIWLN